jgi:mannose-1-phosphate guanylyltransferase
VVVEGSVIPSLDFEALLLAHRRTGAAATAVVEVDRRRSASGSLPPRQSGGIYVFSRDVLEGVPASGFHDIKQGLLEDLYAHGVRTNVYEVPGLSPRVLDFATYTATNRTVINSAARRPEFFGDFDPVGEGFHHRLAQVDGDARLIGPVLVGRSARVEPGAVIIGPTSIGAGSVIGPGAVISRSVVLERCSVGAYSLIDNSLLAHGTVIEPGEQCTQAVRIDDPDAEPCGPPPVIQLRMSVHPPDTLRVASPSEPVPVLSRPGHVPDELMLAGREYPGIPLRT